jgi:hypothetical protein
VSVSLPCTPGAKSLFERHVWMRQSFWHTAPREVQLQPQLRRGGVYWCRYYVFGKMEKWEDVIAVHGRQRVFAQEFVRSYSDVIKCIFSGWRVL